MKKICFYTDSVFDLGGIQRVITDIANSLIEEYDITILCSYRVNECDKVNYNLDDRIKVEYLPKASLIFSIINIFFKPFRYFFSKIFKLSERTSLYGFLFYQSRINLRNSLSNFFRNNDFDYILAEGLPICIKLSLVSKKINNAITIGCWHSSYERYVNDYPNKLVEYSLNSLTKTVVLSKNDQNLIKNRYDIDVDYVYNPIKKQEVSSNNVVKENKFIAVGRYNKIKGYDMLIEAFKIFNSKNKKWKLEIIGEGPERNNLQKLIKKYDLENYVFLAGQTSNIDVYYNNASIFLMTSRLEGFGMVLVEAMQHKLPIIAFDVPVFHEILPDSVPIIEQGNVLEYAKKMEELVENKNGINSMIEDYDECLKKFYIDNILDEWRNILK